MHGIMLNGKCGLCTILVWAVKKWPLLARSRLCEEVWLCLSKLSFMLTRMGMLQKVRRKSFFTFTSVFVCLLPVVMNLFTSLANNGTHLMMSPG